MTLLLSTKIVFLDFRPIVQTDDLLEFSISTGLPFVDAASFKKLSPCRSQYTFRAVFTASSIRGHSRFGVQPLPKWREALLCFDFQNYLPIRVPPYRHALYGWLLPLAPWT